MFNQQSSPAQQPVIWDYHVILLNTSNSQVYDFDTRASFISDALHYFDLSFPENIKADYQATFRIIPAETYLERFSSDRSHMLGLIEDSQFPDYPAIQSDNPLYLNDLIYFNKPISLNEKILSLSEMKLRLIKFKL